MDGSELDLESTAIVRNSANQINGRLSPEVMRTILLKANHFLSLRNSASKTKSLDNYETAESRPSSTPNTVDSFSRTLLSSVCSGWAELMRSSDSPSTSNRHQQQQHNGTLKNEDDANAEVERSKVDKDDAASSIATTSIRSPSETATVAAGNAEIVEPRLFRRRWLIVLLFASYSATNAYQWLHLVIISDKVIIYYNASLPDSDFGQSVAVDMLSMIYMIAYIPLIFPATWLLDRRGLRLTAILGCLLNAAGAWIKCGAVGPDRFALLFFAQTICAIAQVFILGIPTRLAAVWFGVDEVSTATSIGVFGNQIGCALGFVIPPEIVTSEEVDAIGHSLSIMMYGGAAVTTLLLLLVLIFFKNSPPVPPSMAQVAAGKMWSKEDYCGSLRRLMTNVGFVLLVITYGINVGSFYEISTLLNSFLLYYFPDDVASAGNIGLTMVVTGIVGSIIAGLWLDRTKRFKITTVGIYVLSFAGMVAFTFTLDLNQIWIVFVCIGILGFFMTGYLPVGFEFAAELTFPESEGTSSGLLNASAQVFGIILTLSVRAMTSLPNGMLAGNITISAILLLGAIGTVLIKSDLRRQAAQKKKLSEAFVDVVITTVGVEENDFTNHRNNQNVINLGENGYCEVKTDKTNHLDVMDKNSNYDNIIQNNAKINGVREKEDNHGVITVGLSYEDLNTKF